MLERQNRASDHSEDRRPINMNTSSGGLRRLDDLNSAAMQPDAESSSTAQLESDDACHVHQGEISPLPDILLAALISRFYSSSGAR